MKRILPKIASIVLVLTVLVTVLGCGGQGETLTIFQAGSLAVPFEALETEFEGSHTDVDVDRQSGGSATIISNAIAQEDAGESPPDIIASADYKLIPDRMYEGGYADWYIAFARNTMALCYRDNAPGSDEIVSGNRTWFDVLRNDPVSYGHSDPDQDPCGYRTLLAVQLAQKYYYDDAASFNVTPDEDADGLYDALISGSEHERGRTGGTNLTARPGGSEEVVSAKSVDLVLNLDSGDLDYAFEYRSVAVQHGLNFIELNEYINLSMTNEELPGVEDFYYEASIEILTDPGPPAEYAAKHGAAIVYGITIPVNAENEELAAKFIELLLSETGQEIIETENGQPMLDPPLCDHPENLPASLHSLFD
ncbi:MAG: tungstate ABC transporter substrate-binding protein WtpA [Chloroflexota bacterium]|nr:tungstate ABC transporter substrate-binding protein WtpA [Chloroflexota bacterium]